jgi:hypothetical protein
MNETRIVVSAIVISFHGRKFLGDCLTTLIADLQEIPHEIIVVDNGSTDGSIEIIKQVAPNARLIEHGRNLGFARAVNAGISAARGELLWILNQDIRVRRGCLKALVDRIAQDEHIGMIGPKFVGFDGVLQYSARAFPRYRFVIYKALLLDRLFPDNREFGGWKMTWFDHESEMAVEQPMGSAMLVPRRVIDEIGMLDESFPIFFNDVDFCRRMHDAGFVLLYCPEAVIEHFVGGSTRRRPTRMVIESHRSLYRYLRKYVRPHEYPLLWLCGILLAIGIVPRLVWAAFKPKEPTVQAPTSVSR